jgi:hypothetical protein
MRDRELDLLCCCCCCQCCRWLPPTAVPLLFPLPRPPAAAVPLTEDHKPDRSDERDRVESRGGTVVWAGTWRVGGVLAVSRSFGNRMMKHLIIPHPEIREDILHGGGRWVGSAGQGPGRRWAAARV